MKIDLNRRNFLRGLAGSSMLAAGGCFSIGKPDGKIRLAAVGVMGKGYSDWTPMIQSGLAKIVAFCDADYAARESAQKALIRDGIDFDVYSVPFYTDYRKLLEDAGVLGIQAMTISTPDHVHAPVAIQAMKMGIHVYVQKPLVRTLWELDYFNRTAKEYGVVVQMGNQGSSLHGGPAERHPRRGEGGSCLDEPSRVAAGQGALGLHPQPWAEGRSDSRRA